MKQASRRRVEARPRTAPAAARHGLDPGLRAQLLGQQIRTIGLHHDEGCERCCERRRQSREAAPAAAAIRQRHDVAWTRRDRLHHRRHHCGRHRGHLRQPHRRFRLDRRDGRADLAPHFIGGLHRADHGVQLAEPAFPLLDDELELGVRSSSSRPARALRRQASRGRIRRPSRYGLRRNSSCQSQALADLKHAPAKPSLHGIDGRIELLGQLLAAPSVVVSEARGVAAPAQAFLRTPEVA